MMLLLVLSCFFEYTYGQERHLQQPRKTNYPFQQALAQLYIQKPYLLQPQQTVECKENNFQDTNIKKIFNYASIVLPLAYFCYGTLINYNEYHNSYHHSQKNYINQMLTKIFPGLFINSPRHISFFLQETEILLQAYLLKIMLKLIIFCFF